MSTLDNKIDFAVILSVKNANPNGDPLSGNSPRITFDGFGEISDVCIKRKIRNRLQDFGEKIFVQSNDRCDDGFKSLKERAAANKELAALNKKKDSRDDFAKTACAEWIDVRSFGQVFAFKKPDDNSAGISVGVRGPVSIHPAFSISPVDIEDIQITKSVNSEPDDKKGSDTMGMKHRVNFGIYKFFGSINCQLAEKTGFSKEDAEKIHEALKTLFENDSSSARPDGSMEVTHVYWWKHNCKSGQYSSARVHRSLSIKKKLSDPKSIEDYIVEAKPLEGLVPEIFNCLQ